MASFYDRTMATPGPIAITVIGGYLGAGKTTLLNRLLEQSSDRRIGVIVNDFGELGIDASLITAAIDDADGDAVPIVNLANGCVCCTLGDDLRATIETLGSIEPRIDHIVIEASGVADPATAAAWGTVPGFEPGGVVVLAAADSVVQSSRDRYVGSEVLRQLAGADLLVLTKGDLVDDARQSEVLGWLKSVGTAPIVTASHGALPIDVILGATPRRTGRRFVDPVDPVDPVRYVRWAADIGTVADCRLHEFLDRLPDGVLRAKGEVAVTSASGEVGGRLVQVVGHTVTVTPTAVPDRGRLEAIGPERVLDVASLQSLVDDYLRGR
jgi:G3E family GTPase